MSLYLFMTLGLMSFMVWVSMPFSRVKSSGMKRALWDISWPGVKPTHIFLPGRLSEAEIPPSTGNAWPVM